MERFPETMAESLHDQRPCWVFKNVAGASLFE